MWMGRTTLCDKIVVEKLKQREDATKYAASEPKVAGNHVRQAHFIHVCHANNDDSVECHINLSWMRKSIVNKLL